MPQKLLLAGGEYALLAVFLFACWGVGRPLLRMRAGSMAPPLAITLGIGVVICALQALAIAGWLRKGPVLALLGIGLLLGMRGLAGVLRRARHAPGLWQAWTQRSRTEKFALAALVLVALPTLLAPLRPPMAWDELMYHLPQAAQWAATGKLQVNAWLRYPWFPYNYDLLYAAALVFGNDVLPHLLHAAAGWLTTWLVYLLGVRHLDRVTAALAAALWLALSADQYDRAYVDMGMTLFILMACVALQQWRETADRRWVAVCAFGLGLAAGTKYQVLALLPFFAVMLALRDRRPSTWLLAITGIALPCIYWYARNAVMTGDPFNPIGGRLFGFTDWNLADYRGQFEDLQGNAGWPHWALWAGLVVPFVPALRRQPAVRAAMWMSLCMLLVWASSSRYPRYLLFAYPLLVLLSAAGAMQVLRRAMAHLPVPWAAGGDRWGPPLLLVVLALAGAAAGHSAWKRIAPTADDRDTLLRERVPGYAMWTYLHAHPAGRTYQFGLEGSLYYAPQPIWGDVFGPWRYRDYAELPPQQLHDRLKREGFESLVIDTARLPRIASGPGFEQFFIPVHTAGAVRLYRLAP